MICYNMKNVCITDKELIAFQFLPHHKHFFKKYHFLEIFGYFQTFLDFLDILDIFGHGRFWIEKNEHHKNNATVRLSRHHTWCHRKKDSENHSFFDPKWIILDLEHLCSQNH